MQFMRRLLQFGMILLLVLAAGCAQTAAPPAGNEPAAPGNNAPHPAAITVQSYFPVTAGSSWTYQGEGNEYASFTREVIFSRDNRGQFKESNGGTVSSAVFEVSPDAVTRIFFKGEEYQPDNLLNRPDFIGNDNTILIKAPLTAGTTWTNAAIEKRIVSLDATVATPAGKFEKCLQVEAYTPDSVVTEFYKENVGLVKREFKSGDAVISSSLLQYKVMP